MANIRYNYLIICIKKLMVFYIGCNVKICAGSNCIPDEETAGTSANGNFFYFFIQQTCVPDNR